MVGDNVNIDLGFDTVKVEENNVPDVKPERVPFKSKLRQARV